jgi:acyl transferase domain-containing protein
MSESPTAQMQEVLKKSLITIKKLESELESLRQRENEPIAIVGVGCRLPGGIERTAQLWDLLVKKEHTFREVPKERWDINAVYDKDPLQPGKTNARNGAFLDHDVKAFDNDFFGIVPREARSLDPLQRMILEVTQEALENAAIAPSSLRGKRTGVYVAIGVSDYMQARLRSGDLDTVDVYDATGIPFCTAAGRISYYYDLNGPNMALDAACASALTGIHLACEALRHNEADQAIIASANLLLTPELYVGLAKLGSVSASGDCRAFDETADGYVRGEGCGVVVLKRLSDAQADNDNILGLIRGSAVKHDGLSNGFTAPNPVAQLNVIKEVQQKTGIGEDAVDFVEAHGIGNRFTDAMEIQAVASGYRKRDKPVYVGSLKPNIGHLEACIGMPMLFKVLESFHHDAIAPNRAFQIPNADIDWENITAKVPVETLPWPKSRQPRMAAINLSGYSGTNVHMVIQEAPEVKNDKPLLPWKNNLFVLSAKSDKALKALVDKYLSRPEIFATASLQDIAYTLQVGRDSYDHLLAVIAEQADTVQEALLAFAAGEKHKSLSVQSPVDRSKEVAFLFTGQGAQYAGMCRELYDTDKVFRDAVEDCAAVLKPLLETPITDVLFGENVEPSLIDQTAYTQPALFVIEYALAKWWMNLGVQPAALAGHSVGEYVALTIAGALKLEDALKLIAERARLMQSLPVGVGAMAAVLADEAFVKGYLQEGVDIAAVNSPKALTISGEQAAVAAVTEKLKADKIKVIPLTVSHAFHSALMEPILAAFEQFAATIPIGSMQLTVISNVTGKELLQEEITPKYFAQHLRGTVRFADNMQYLSETLGIDIFLECGPNPTLIGLGKQGITKDQAVWAASAKKDASDWDMLWVAIRDLYMAGIRLNWQSLYAGWQVHKVSDMPTYAWQRKVFWADPVFSHRQLKPVMTGAESINADEVLHEITPDLSRKSDFSILTPVNLLEIMHRESQRILGLDADTRLDEVKSLRDQGFDSMMSGEFLSSLEKLFNTQLEISLMHTYGTMETLHAYLVEKYMPGGRVENAKVTMDDIMFSSDFGGAKKQEDFHTIQPGDNWLMRVFKKIDKHISVE